MAKSIKLKSENYIDSSCIVDSRSILKDILDNTPRATGIHTIKYTSNGLADTRNYNSIPSEYRNLKNGCYREFKKASAINCPSSSTFVYLITFVVWQDSTGGNVIQLALSAGNDSEMYIRTGFSDDTGWNEWKTIANNNLISATYSNTNIKNGNIYFRKVGKTVYVETTGDLVNLPFGDNTYIAEISDEFKPITGTFRCNSYNNKAYIVLEISGNTVKLLNYDATISSATNGGFMATYLSES